MHIRDSILMVNDRSKLVAGLFIRVFRISCELTKNYL